jgi:hypothetical protein
MQVVGRACTQACGADREDMVRGRAYDQMLVACFVTPDMFCVVVQDIQDSCQGQVQEGVRLDPVCYLRDNSSLLAVSDPAAPVHKLERVHIQVVYGSRMILDDRVGPRSREASYPNMEVYQSMHLEDIDSADKDDLKSEQTKTGTYNPIVEGHEPEQVRQHNDTRDLAYCRTHVPGKSRENGRRPNENSVGVDLTAHIGSAKDAREKEGDAVVAVSCQMRENRNYLIHFDPMFLPDSNSDSLIREGARQKCRIEHSRKLFRVIDSKRF